MKIKTKIKKWDLTKLKTFTHQREPYVFICVQLFTASWTTAHQAPLPMEFSRHEYLSGVPFPTRGGLSNPGTETESFTSPALAGRFFTTNVTWEAHKKTIAKMKRKS